jgi:hypothetical protein
MNFKDRFLIFFISIMFLLIGCGKEKGIEKEGSNKKDLKDLSMPEILSAKIIPEMATKMSDIKVIVDGNRLNQKGVVIHYQWKKNGEDIEGATNSHLSPENFSKGDKLSVIIIPSKDGKEGKPFESRTVIVHNSPPTIKGIALIPDVIFRGSRVQAKVDAEDPDGDEISFTYQWILNGKELVDQKGDTLEGVDLKRGDKVSVRVMASDGEIECEPIVSRTLIVQNSPPKIHSNPPPFAKDGGIYQYNVEATDPDGDPIQFSLGPSAPHGMVIDAKTGVIQWKIPAGTNRDYRIEIFADDGNGGRSVQRYILMVGAR